MSPPATRWEKLERRGLSWNELCALENELVRAVTEHRDRRFLLVSEPRPVYTAGRNADTRGLLVTPEALAAAGIDWAVAPRGGQWTYHGPGQVVLYPIAALGALGLGPRAVRAYADRFRHAVADAIRGEGLAPELREAPYGIYLDGAKVASFGLSFHRGIAAHGVAVYWKPQHEPFRRIDPCGVAGARITSLEEHGVTRSWETMAARLTDAVAAAFP